MSSFGSFGYTVSEEDGISLSLPYDMGYPDGERRLQTIANENKPRIMMCGQRMSGKTSILKVVFHKMSANETLYLGQTNELGRDDIDNSIFVQFQIWDVPGDFNLTDRSDGRIFDSDKLFQDVSCIVYVIDARDDYHDSLLKLHGTVARAYEVNPAIKFNVFIHKVDGLSDEQKLDVNRRIHHQTMEELSNSKLDGIYINFFVTTIYDHSIFEAFSKVIQKLNPLQPVLENLLDSMVINCHFEKAFLVDVVSKLYITTDSSPFDSQTFELCDDMIDVVIDVSCIYGKDENEVLSGQVDTKSVIRLSNNKVLYLREVNRYLAFICLLKSDVFEKQGLIDYNFDCLKKAISEIYHEKGLELQRKRELVI